jgi:hypothetical protein
MKGRVACMEKMRSAYGILIGKLEVKRAAIAQSV